MRRTGVRILATLLSLILVLGSTCLYVDASGEDVQFEGTDLSEAEPEVEETVGQDQSVSPALVGSGEETGGPVTWTELADKFQEETAETNITLTIDITCDTDTRLIVPAGKKVVLDLNGHSLYRNHKGAEEGEVIYVPSTGSLTINDSAGNGSITGGRVRGGIYNEGYLTINGGTIVGNSSDENGGGIYNAGTLIMEDGRIFGNASTRSGGGIYTTGIMAVKGGSITSNTADENGGGISSFGYTTISGGSILNNTGLNSGGGIFIGSSSTTITDVEISNNDATGLNGGGIYIDTDGVLNLYGGSVTSNFAGTEGGGIFANVGKEKFKIQGKPMVTGNFAGVGTNVMLETGCIIAITAGLEEGAAVDICMRNPSDEIFTKDYGTYNSGTNPKNFFTACDGYAVALSDTNEVKLVKSIEYLKREWDGNTVTETVDHMEDAKGVTSQTTLMQGGNYVVDSDVIVSDTISISGEVNLLLMDGKTLTAEDGIYIMDGSTLYIWGQSGDSGCIKANTEDDKAAIGGMDDVIGGSLVINGGTIDATADHNNAAGIGGGNNASGIRSITINGGNVTARSSSSAAAIGKGQQNNVWETITINGGTVKAYAGDYGAGIGGSEDRGNGLITINGGYVEAVGGDEAAGIGGGEEGNQDGMITINGGTVIATGGDYGAGIGGGDGIGNGEGGCGGIILINGGDVTAKGGYGAAGIGGGKRGWGGDITIKSGKVTATGGSGAAGIGAGHICPSKGTNITIDGGTVTAQGGNNGSGIGGSGEVQSPQDPYETPELGGFETIRINGGTITARGGDNGPGIGNGYAGKADGVITISGGTIWSYGGPNGAGIGGGDYSNGCTVKVYGGTINAVGGANAAGIGGGRGLLRSSLALTNYPVGGKGGDVYINGGCVCATAGSDARAIGGGARIVSEHGNINLADLMSVLYGSSSESTVRASSLERVSSCSQPFVEVSPCPHPDGTCIDLDDSEHYWVCEYCGADSETSKEAHVFDHETHQCASCTHREYAVTCEVTGSEYGEASLQLDNTNNETEGYTSSGKLVYLFTTADNTHYASLSVTYLKEGVLSELKPFMTNASADGKVVNVYIMPAADLTINVDFKILEYTVSFEAGDGSGSMDAVTLVRGSEYVLPECTMTPPEGKTFNGWQVGDESTGTIMVPGDTITVDADTVITALWENLPRFMTQSLLLSGQIGVNFYMDLPEIRGVDYTDTDTCYMEFTVSGKDGETIKAYYDPNYMNQAGNYYGFICHVSSIQMADTITAVFHYSQDGETKTLEAAYSVNTYLNAVISGNNSDVLKNLCTAIGDYGYYEQQYLSAVRGWTLGTENADHMAMPQRTVYGDSDIAAALDGVNDFAAAVEKKEAAGVKNMTFSLVLDSGTDINLYLKKNDSYDGEIKAFVGNSTENAAVLDSDGRYVVKISGISAHKIGDTYTVTASADGENVIKISALSYVDTVLNGASTQEAKKAVTALYNYYARTVEYQEAVSAS